MSCSHSNFLSNTRNPVVYFLLLHKFTQTTLSNNSIAVTIKSKENKKSTAQKYQMENRNKTLWQIRIKFVFNYSIWAHKLSEGIWILGGTRHRDTATNRKRDTLREIVSFWMITNPLLWPSSITALNLYLIQSVKYRTFDHFNLL